MTARNVFNPIGEKNSSDLIRANEYLIKSAELEFGDTWPHPDTRNFDAAE
jgi:hypothetical protein